MKTIESNNSAIIKPLCISLKNICCSENGKNSIIPSLPENVNDIGLAHDDINTAEERYQFSEDANLDLKKKYTCSHAGCIKWFGKQSRLVVHERTHTGERPFRCEYNGCDKTYTRQFHLSRHINVSHSSTVRDCTVKYKCDKCNKEFQNVYCKKKHETRFHKDERYLCKICGHMFRKQQHLKTHSYEHTGIKPYRCDYPGCESSFTVPSKLKRHSFSHQKGRYICSHNQCSLKFDTYNDLRHHLGNFHLKCCDVCGKEFSTFSRLRTHLASHNNVREAFFCPYSPCQRYYFGERSLQDHIHSKHDENFKGFQCSICSSWLVTSQKLKEHNAMHESNGAPNARKPKSKKERKPRKDKGISRTDFAKLISGYSSGDERVIVV